MTLPEHIRAALASPPTLRAVRELLPLDGPPSAAVLVLAPAHAPELLHGSPRRFVPAGVVVVAPLATVRGCVEARAPSALAHLDADPPAGGVRVVTLDASGGVAVASLPVAPVTPSGRTTRRKGAA